ncbi:MAG: FAD:protein FMN transferase [Coriobacteriales bacterium]|nr:FAD:protein FMN transferase [Coriobacteriales bacterium]
MTASNNTKTPKKAAVSQSVKGSFAFDMDSLIHVIQPSKSADGSFQIILPVFNTQVSVKAFPGSKNLTDNALTQALIELRELAMEFELSLSRTRKTSEITRLNDARGQAVELSARTIDLLDKSRFYCEASRGVFDITMGIVTPLWDFHEGIIPREEDLSEALKHVDWRMLEVDKEHNTARLADPVARVDLGGIAKGYIADAFADLLKEHGCDCAFVNLGGNVLTIGSRPDGTSWRIGVRDPAHPEQLRAVVQASSMSVVTSGLYERNFTKDGVFYHHILDPKNGMPVETDIGGATILSKKSLDGDGFSTTLFALGIKNALEFVEERENLEALIIGLDGSVHMTQGIKSLVQLVEV